MAANGCPWLLAAHGFSRLPVCSRLLVAAVAALAVQRAIFLHARCLLLSRWGLFKPNAKAAAQRPASAPAALHLPSALVDVFYQLNPLFGAAGFGPLHRGRQALVRGRGARGLYSTGRKSGTDKYRSPVS